MKKIVTDKNNLIVATGIDIFYYNYNNENVIKVVVNEDIHGFYYIKDANDNYHQIIEVDSLPDDYQPFKYFYDNQKFVLNQNYSE